MVIYDGVYCGFLTQRYEWGKKGKRERRKEGRKKERKIGRYLFPSALVTITVQTCYIPNGQANRSTSMYLVYQNPPKSPHPIPSHLTRRKLTRYPRPSGLWTYLSPLAYLRNRSIQKLYLFTPPTFISHIHPLLLLLIFRLYGSLVGGAKAGLTARKE